MEDVTVQPRFEHQENAVQALCRNAEERLSLAKDLPEALMVRDEVCVRYRKECVSDVLLNASRKYLDEMNSVLHSRDNG